MDTNRSSQIIVLTGPRGIGKSAVCRGAVALAKSRRHRCGGIITLRPSDNTLDAQDVRSGEVRRLTLGSERDSALTLGPFHFDPSTLAWGNTILANAVPCDLLVVDELGPLEFELGQGWMSAFSVLNEAGYALALVVVRPELVDRAQRLLPAQPTTVLTVTRENRDGLPEAIVALLGESLQREAKE